MVIVKDLTQLNLKDIWREVKDEERWWGEINGEVLSLVKLILDTVLMKSYWNS